MSLDYSVGILGRFNMGSIKQGLQDTKSNIREVEEQSVSASSSMSEFGERTNSAFDGLAKSTFAVATSLGVIGMTAPSVAGPMARIQNESFRLSNALGDGLGPAFESIADGMGELSNWVNENSGTLRNFTNSVVDPLEQSLRGLSDIWDNLSSGVSDITGSISIDIDLGGELVKILGVAGAFAFLSRFIPGVGRLGSLTGGRITKSGVAKTAGAAGAGGYVAGSEDGLDFSPIESMVAGGSISAWGIPRLLGRLGMATPIGRWGKVALAAGGAVPGMYQGYNEWLGNDGGYDEDLGVNQGTAVPNSSNSIILNNSIQMDGREVGSGVNKYFNESYDYMD